MESIPARLPEVDSEPLGDLVLDFLIEHDQEEPYLDFKENLDIGKKAAFSEVAKDLLAFSNYGGGFLLIGFRDKSRSLGENDKKQKRQYIPVGLPGSFHVDQADLQTKYNSYRVHHAAIEYKEFLRTIDHETRRFAAIYVPPSTEVVKAAKSGAYIDASGKQHKPFSVGAILFRRGTQSIPASKGEIAFIRTRILDTQYKLGVLSGKPDRINEVILSNLFETSFKEPTICVGSSRESFYSSGDLTKIPNDYVSMRWEGETLTFEDLTDLRNPLWASVDTESIASEPLGEWLADDDRSRIIIALLNKELRFLARRIGLRKVEDRHLFYFPCFQDSLSKTWRPRFRESSQLSVAKKMYISKLRRDMFVHLAVQTGFTVIGNKIFLRLSPTLMLTGDGVSPSIGEKEGAVLTSLLHNRYNQAYLNSVLFWISQFSQGRDAITLAHGRISVSSQPTESKVNAGILADRPTSEETPEIAQRGAS